MPISSITDFRVERKKDFNPTRDIFHRNNEDQRVNIQMAPFIAIASVAVVTMITIGAQSLLKITMRMRSVIVTSHRGFVIDLFIVIRYIVANSFFIAPYVACLKIEILWRF